MSNRSRVQRENLENIRSAVDKLVREVGFEQMTVRQICAEAGVSTGTFYYNFKSKDELVADRFVRSGQHFAELFDEKLKDLPPLDALKAYVVDSIAYTNSRVLPMLTQYLKVAITETARWRSERKFDYTMTIRALFARAQAEGTICADYSPEQLQYMLGCMMMGASYMRCMNGDVMHGDHSTAQLAVKWLDDLRAK